MDDNLVHLAELLHEKHQIDVQIAALVGRPAQIGHVGEYIASAIFGIVLEHSAVAKGIDGHFASGSLAGRSVNIKWYGKLQWLLDITPAHPPDDYLVMTGPTTKELSSRGGHRPWLITQVFLFDAAGLIAAIGARGSQIGIATSVPQSFWNAAELYPTNRNTRLVLSPIQRAQLALFAPRPD